jgi:hypothetical protein
MIEKESTLGLQEKKKKGKYREVRKEELTSRLRRSLLSYML